MARRSTKGARIERHGHTTGGISPTYVSWSSMIQRCTNPECDQWQHYGGAGVRVHPRWLKFPAFLADMGVRPDGTTLDRVRVAGNYEPGNCKWASASEQQRNKRGTKLYTQNGRSLPMVAWADELGISKELAFYRFKHWGTFMKGQAWQLQKTK